MKRRSQEDNLIAEAESLIQQTKKGIGSNYRGELDLNVWADIVGRHRDSSLLEEHNFEAALAKLEAADPEGENVDIERYGHFAVGWIEELFVRMFDESGNVTEAGKVAIDLKNSLENYPILDEDRYSELEYEKAYEWILEEIGYIANREGNETANAEAIYEWLYENNMRAIERVEEDPESHSIEEDAVLEAMEALGMLDDDEGSPNIPGAHRKFSFNTYQVARDAAEDLVASFPSKGRYDMYLWYLPYGEQIVIDSDPPTEEWELVTSERVPLSRDAQGIAAWIEPLIRTIPILKRAHRRISAIDVEQLGRECANEAIDAGGPDPTNVDGENLLPTMPLQGDWEYLKEKLGREPTDEEAILFENAYSEIMKAKKDEMAMNGSYWKRGQYSKVAYFEDDQSVARELELYAENTSELYNQRQSIEKNLINKMAQGVYDSQRAVQAFMYLMDSAAKMYTQEFGDGTGWNEMFPKNIREEAARTFVESFEAEAELGNYDHLLHKKYQKGGKNSKNADSWNPNIPKRLPKYVDRNKLEPSEDAIEMFIEQSANVAAREWLDQGLVEYYNESGHGPDDFVVTQEDIDYFSMEFEEAFGRQPSEEEISLFEGDLAGYVAELV